MDSVKDILTSHGFSEDNIDKVKDYIDSITRLNQVETAENIGVSKNTIQSWKQHFQEMTEEERAYVIQELAKWKYRQVSKDPGT